MIGIKGSTFSGLSSSGLVNIVNDLFAFKDELNLLYGSTGECCVLLSPLDVSYFLTSMFPALLNEADNGGYEKPMLVFENSILGGLCEADLSFFSIDSLEIPGVKLGKIYAYPFYCTGCLFPQDEDLTLVGIFDQANPDKFAYIAVSFDGAR